jgi:hypothetical protein
MLAPAGIVGYIITAPFGLLIFRSMFVPASAGSEVIIGACSGTPHAPASSCAYLGDELAAGFFLVILFHHPIMLTVRRGAPFRSWAACSIGDLLPVIVLVRQRRNLRRASTAPPGGDHH